MKIVFLHEIIELLLINTSTKIKFISCKRSSLRSKTGCCSMENGRRVTEFLLQHEFVRVKTTQCISVNNENTIYISQYMLMMQQVPITQKYKICCTYWKVNLKQKMRKILHNSLEWTWNFQNTNSCFLRNIIQTNRQ